MKTILLLLPRPLIITILLMLISAPALGSQGKITLAYVPWSSAIASNNMVKAVLQEKLGYQCQLKAVSADDMWRLVASGEVDAIVSAWLPLTHCKYYEKYKDKVVDLGPNLEGTKIGLVVPDITVGRLTAGTGIRNRPYITVQSIDELKEYADKFQHRIIGIDPESGVMQRTREAMQAYGLDNYRLIEGSEVSMVAELSHAIRHQKWIVVTGWLPHWIFARWELKFLKDPKGVYGQGGSIHTVVRQGLKEDEPRAYRFLDNFKWRPEDIGQLMLWNSEDKSLYPYEKALRWMRTHPETIQEWIQDLG